MSEQVTVNEIVQVVPEHDWAGTLMVVTEVKDWGIVCYTQMPNSEGQAYIRLTYKDFERTGGVAPFVLAD